MIPFGKQVFNRINQIRWQTFGFHHRFHQLNGNAFTFTDNARIHIVWTHTEQRNAMHKLT
ncbi:Uncharacterised protein [Vibrio cholerae]|uniref:Uncharacterized protein n=1 Tax=Vibrio cholerae TaxID=666 RepID=A0A655W5K7_VIBCL|nr:Uncharacterised protein [Vibrio cholerae]